MCWGFCVGDAEVKEIDEFLPSMIICSSRRQCTHKTNKHIHKKVSSIDKKKKYVPMTKGEGE